MFCPNCGTALEPGIQFCPHCGTALQAAGHTGGPYGQPTQSAGRTGGQYGQPTQSAGHTGGPYGQPAQSAGRTGGQYGQPTQSAGHTGGQYGQPTQSAGRTGGQYGQPTQSAGHTGGQYGARPTGSFGGPSASRPAGPATGPFGGPSAGQAGAGGVCARCGAPLEPGSLFCDQCGTMTSEGVTPPPGSPSSGRTPRRKKGISKKIVALIAVGGVLAVSALALVVVPMVVQLLNPNAYLTACAGNTFTRFNSASDLTAENLGVTSILESAKHNRVEQHLDLSIKELPRSLADYSTQQLISDAVLSMVSQSDLENRQMALAYTLALGGMDLAGVTVALDDGVIALNAPELWGDTFYGINTETLGVDFNNNPLFHGLIDPDVSFNLFDTLERWQQEKLVLTDETLARIEELNKQLIAQMQVERAGTVNAVLSAQSIRSWIRGVYDAVIADKNINSYFELALEGSGMTLSDVTGILSSSIDQGLSYITEDVTLVCTITDNYISQVEARTTFQGVDLTLRLAMGGGAHPMDGFSLQIEAEDQDSGQNVAIHWTSQGNHSAQGGVYTDETQIDILQDGSTLGSISWSTSWEPEASGENFSWTLNLRDSTTQYDVFTLSATGAVTVDRRASSLSADLSDVSLTADGETLSLRLNYSIAPCDSLTMMPDSSQVTLIPGMTEDQLEDLAREIEENAWYLSQRVYELTW